MNFWTGISNSSYKLSEIPSFNPVTDRYEYLDFWKSEKRKCIEGTWQSGKWMPGPLYFYINYFHIKAQDIKSVGEKLILPWLRDIDWELFLLYEECRGFSGFSGDKVYTCNRFLGPEKAVLKELGIFELYIEKGLIRKEDLLKTYTPARDYLRTVQLTAMGKPLYDNKAKNFISMQSRGSGKSFSSAAIIAHNFIFGGSTDYDYYLQIKAEGGDAKSDTIVGAIDTKYSKPLIDKVLLGYSKLPGEVQYLDTTFRAPFYVGFKGSPRENRDFTNKHGSVVYHRTFRNNPLAGNAGRPNLMVIDEIGFFDILAEALAGVEGSQVSQIHNRLVIWMLGTGGYVNGGSINYVEHIFRDPEKYNCLAFDDEWEKRGKIGYFVPITKANNTFKKGENLVTDLETALKYENIQRQKKKGDRKKYSGHIINSPLVPSEVFLLTEGTRFPTILLKDHLQELLGGSRKYLVDHSYRGWMKFNDQSEPYLDVSENAFPIRNYPIGKTNKGVEEDPTGCVEIFLKPVKGEHGDVARNRYIAGADVVDKDRATTDSLPSIFIYDRLTNKICAEYTGRTDDAKFFYEQARMLCLYYKASLMYEQNLVGLFTYFSQHNSTYLLADTPRQLRNSDTYRENTNTAKGINASTKVNSTAVDFIASWLISPVAKDKEVMNLTTIQSPALIQELIKWNTSNNTDRVSALGMLFWHEETLNKVERANTEKTMAFVESEFFAKRGLISHHEQVY